MPIVYDIRLHLNVSIKKHVCIVSGIIVFRHMLVLYVHVHVVTGDPVSIQDNLYNNICYGFRLGVLLILSQSLFLCM